jgi:anti-anti-sigma regulatory factor
MSLFKKHQPLKYFLAETHENGRDYSSLLVTLIGALNADNESIYRKCLEDISRSASKWVIINFRDVPDKSDPTFLVSCLQKLKDLMTLKKSHFILSGVHPHLRKILEAEQIASGQEICNNLSEAIQALPPRIRSDEKSTIT